MLFKGADNINNDLKALMENPQIAENSDSLFEVAYNAALANGIENKPFEVIDDCWQIHSCEGPWIPNEKFRDMKKQLEQLQDDLHLMNLDPNDKGNQFLLEQIDQSLFKIITKL